MSIGNLELSETNKDNGAVYGEDYLNWKNWDVTQFGILTKLEERHLTSEISKSKCSFPPKSSVLEIGFGNGNFLTYGKNRDWDIYGTEVNKYLVEVAKQNGFNVLQTYNLECFAENMFDLVAAFDVLEHIPQDKLLDFLTQIKRILKNNGVFIARFPNGDSPFSLLYQNGDMTHVTTIGSLKVKYLAKKLGVDLIYVGSESQRLWAENVVHITHYIIAAAVKRIVNVLVNLIFYPLAKPAFTSLNLIMIFRVLKRP